MIEIFTHVSTVTVDVPYDTRFEVKDIETEEREDGYYVTAPVKYNGSKTSGAATVTLTGNIARYDENGNPLMDSENKPVYMEKTYGNVKVIITYDSMALHFA